MLLVLIHENKDAREKVVFRVYVYLWPFWGSEGAPDGREWKKKVEAKNG